MIVSQERLENVDQEEERLKELVWTEKVVSEAPAPGGWGPRPGEGGTHLTSMAGPGGGATEEGWAEAP